MKVAGVDEAGRGPLAGPVVAAAVILPADCHIVGLGDSKQLSAKTRATLEPVIKRRALCWAVAQVEADQIDELNILQASLLAMKKAIHALAIRPDHAMIDGKFIPQGLNCQANAIVKGDGCIKAISAASVLAKEYRDRLLVSMDQLYPQYGFASHKGYPTKMHIAAIKQFGVCPIHRRTFSPVAKVLGAAEADEIHNA